jgi:hypothetical protein
MMMVRFFGNACAPGQINRKIEATIPRNFDVLSSGTALIRLGRMLDLRQFAE